MIERIGKPAMLEQLAEESADLAQVALKATRIERGENPTPVTANEAWEHLREEYTDVQLCVAELDLIADPIVAIKKLKRFDERWAENEGNRSNRDSKESS